MTGACMARTGFLTLSDCGAPAASMCTSCGRPMCSLHLAPQSGFTQCLDCVAHGTQQGDDLPPPDDEYGPAWRHTYRDHYYRSTAYQPYYDGDDDTFDDYDVRSFDDDANGGTDDADDESAGSFTES